MTGGGKAHASYRRCESHEAGIMLVGYLKQSLNKNNPLYTFLASLHMNSRMTFGAF
jgi:hypothetical protein